MNGEDYIFPKENLAAMEVKVTEKKLISLPINFISLKAITVYVFVIWPVLYCTLQYFYSSFTEVLN